MCMECVSLTPAQAACITLMCSVPSEKTAMQRGALLCGWTCRPWGSSRQGGAQVLRVAIPGQSLQQHTRWGDPAVQEACRYTADKGVGPCPVLQRPQACGASPTPQLAAGLAGLHSLDVLEGGPPVHRCVGWSKHTCVHTRAGMGSLLWQGMISSLQGEIKGVQALSGRWCGGAEESWALGWPWDV